MDLNKVDHLEVIDQHGRMVVLYDIEAVQATLQDDGRTLKVTLRTHEQTG